MSKLLLVLAAALLLTSCATAPEARKTGLGYLKSPQEVEAHIQRTVDAKTLKAWGSVVSDDTAIIEIKTDQRTGTVTGTIR